MKILYIITKSNWGGAQRYVYDLAGYFNVQDGYEVAIALGGDGELKKKLGEKNIRVILLAALERDIKITGDIRAFFEILKLLHEEKPDIIHLNSTKAGFLGALATFFCRLNPKPYTLNPRVVFTAHGWAFNEPRPLWQKLLIVFMQWTTVMLCDRTIVVSEYLKKQTRWWPFVPQKISVIHNGVPELSFLPHTEAITRFPNIQHTTYNIHITTIAELHRNKGIDVAINALACLRRQALLKDINFSYTIIGDGEERVVLETLIKKHCLENRIFLAGHIPDAYKYLKTFDLFLLPSRTEALGYALLEAAQAGLPVIATSVGGIPEIIEHKKNGLLVPPNDPRALAHALRFMIMNPDACAYVASEIHGITKNKFSLETMFEKMQRIYDAAFRQEGLSFFLQDN